MEKTLKNVDDVVIRFAGDSGDGMQLTGGRFTDTAAIVGNDIQSVQELLHMAEGLAAAIDIATAYRRNNNAFIQRRFNSTYPFWRSTSIRQQCGVVLIECDEFYRLIYDGCHYVPFCSFNIRPRLPEGWYLAKSSGVKPRSAFKAIASPSPTAS